MSQQGPTSVFIFVMKFMYLKYEVDIFIYVYLFIYVIAIMVDVWIIALNLTSEFMFRSKFWMNDWNYAILIVLHTVGCIMTISGSPMSYVCAVCCMEGFVFWRTDPNTKETLLVFLENLYVKAC